MTYTPSRRNKYRVSRAYNRLATEEQKQGKDNYGSTDGRCLDPKTARNIQANYDRAGLAYRITISQKVRYDRSLGGSIIRDQETTLYARPEVQTVDGALAALTQRKERFAEGGNSSTGNDITDEEEPCIKIYLIGRSKGDDTRTKEIDYQERMAWLINHYGSKKAVERELGIPRRTQTRILQGRLER
jgi:hypothetical protein